jgi:hypothetical protein
MFSRTAAKVVLMVKDGKGGKDAQKLSPVLAPYGIALEAGLKSTSPPAT